MSQPSPDPARVAWQKRLPALAFLLIAAWFYYRTISYRGPSHVDLSSLTLQNLDGSLLPPKTTQGKPIVLNFWAPWCGPCRTEMPWLQRLQTDHPDLAVIGIEDDPDEYAASMALAARTNLTYTLIRASQPVRSTFGHVVMLPTTLYISRSGKVLHSISGIIPETLMRHYANDAIAAQ
jgi:thiol-disulfide isomerase/thioredoxin